MCARAKYIVMTLPLCLTSYLLLFMIPGVCSSVLREDWKCTVPAAALGSRLLHPGMILLVFEDAKGREGLGRGERLFSPNVVFFPCVKIWLH